MNRKRKLGASLVSCSLLLATLGCSTDSAGVAFSDILVEDAPVDDLLAFSATVTELRLVDELGGRTANLLPASVDVEFLGLQQSLGWLANVQLPGGTYSAMELTFQTGSQAAVGRDGTPLSITSMSDVLVAAFTPPVVIGKEYNRIELDLDLRSSLAGDVGSPPLTFTPTGSAIQALVSTPVKIDEIKGIITGFDFATLSLEVDAFVDDDLGVELGTIPVDFDLATLLFDTDESPFASPLDFLGVLLNGSSLLEIHGELGPGGRLEATRLEIEDHAGGTGTAGVVEIEGLITDVVPGTGFDLRIQEIEKGSSIAAPVLLGATTITVSYDIATTFLLGDAVGAGADLLVGREVDVRFSDFLGSPFPAGKVEIEMDEPEFEGGVTDVAGMPGSLTVHLDSSDTAVETGQVASDTTDVIVDLSGATVHVDVEGHPTIPAAMILDGMEIEVEGVLSGAPATPTITASEVEVHPGEVRDGSVTSSTPGTSEFTTVGGTLEDSLGTGFSSGPFTITIHPSCRFVGAATSEADFHALFAGLQVGEDLVVRVRALGETAPGAILAFEVSSEVQ